LPKITDSRAINRIIDANINRAKEGLRVAEEVLRFILESREKTGALKQIRHEVSALAARLVSRSQRLAGRCSLKDVGFGIHAQELKRNNSQDIFFANLQRVKESLRVLEEFAKLKDLGVALGFKKLRYKLYELERKSFKSFSLRRKH
jgi:thiamine-phosphate pyrophosphorylase